MEEVLLSIIVPIYNMENYIERCVNSLIDQTLKSMEIILIDDGSSDNSLNICYEYAKLYQNIRVYSKHNSGLGATRNYGLAFASGKYIGFVDSDDYVDKNMFKCLIESALTNGCDIAMCGYEEVHENSVVTRCDIELKHRILDNRYEIMKEFLMLNIPTFAWNKIYKRDFFHKYNISFSEGCYYEDINTTLKSLHYCNKVFIVDTKYYKYYQRANSIMHTTTKKHLNDYIEQISNCYKFLYKNYNLDNMLIEMKNSKFRLTYNLLRMLKDMKEEEKVEMHFRKLSQPIVIFGASEAGEIILYYLKLFHIEVLYFCDNSNLKWGKYINNVEIIPPRELLKMPYYDYNIFIASMYYREIYNQLKEYKLENRVVDLEVF